MALTADVSKMYCAVELAMTDRDLHCFVWRSNSKEPLQDYRMTQVTFVVFASLFAASMAGKQNSIDHAHEYPLAAEVVDKSFHVDNCLLAAVNKELAITLRQQLSDLFSCGSFLLSKWNSNDPSVLQSIPEELRDSSIIQTISESNESRMECVYGSRSPTCPAPPIA